MLVNIITDLHTSTKRNYLERMTPDKPRCMEISRKFNFHYWDGNRKYGYGGHYKDNRWVPVAKAIIERYGLNERSTVLDIGCGKGFLGYEITRLCGCVVVGFDVSEYALSKCLIPNMRFDAGKDSLGRQYDLIISINTLHNLSLPELKHSIQDISKHTKNAYITMDSYRNTEELHNLQCWALTCEQFHKPEEWEFLFKEWGYTGDYEFIFFK